jgi:uncharacterized protein (TIGR00730 family)
MRGFRALHFVGPCVTVFGSARFSESHPYYAMARQCGSGLAGAGFTVMTGGGPGIMEAANRGAMEAGAPSIGFNVGLPREQEPNAYSTPDLTFRFHYFAVRKFHLVMRANALVIFPGGFGTLDELFEILTLMQTMKMHRIPVVLVDKTYWSKVINFDHLAQERMIAPEDMELFSFADDAENTWAELVRLGVNTGPRIPGYPSV